MCGFVQQIGDPVFISHYHIQKNKGASGQKLHQKKRGFCGRIRLENIQF